MNIKCRHNEKGSTCHAGKLNLFSVIGKLGGALILLMVGMVAQAQIGGYDTPLKYSIHTYTVNMGNASNSVVWNIYDSTATREGIDAIPPVYKAYGKTTAYRVISQTKAAGVASFEIEFSGTIPDSMEAGKKYRLAYREEGGDNCYIYKFLDFVLQSPFDADVLPIANFCPDSNLYYQEGTGIPTSQTTIYYHVALQNNDYNPPGYWYFNYNITVTGQGGASATIEQVAYTGYTWNQPPLISTNSHPAEIPITTRDVEIAVTYNDVPGVRQHVDFMIDGIEGAFSERDVDVINGTLGENEKEHYIDAIPAAGFIAALD
jgi:hypothetical protein